MRGNYDKLENLAAEIERIEKSKQDFIVPHGAMVMEEDDRSLSIKGTGTFALTPISHQQISEKLAIPKRYYDAMEAIPGLRAKNVNSWFGHSSADRKLVRTLDNKGRAFLSDKFVPFDNFTVMESFLPVMRNFADVEVRSLSLTETKMYVQIVFPGMNAEVRPGDVVQAGITLSNSEVGYGAVDISTLVWRQICSNGLVGQSLVSRYHVGKRIQEDAMEMNIFKHDTVRAEIEAFRLRLRDVFEHALTTDVFEAQVRKFREIAEDRIDNPIRAVENVTSRFGLSETEREGTMANLITEGDTTRWGLVNSITALAKSIDNRDRQYQIEQIGYKLVELPAPEWEQLAKGDAA